ncbi:uncharacterized protein SAMN05660668_01384 [Pseudobutyrivibrio sp. AR14]|uniref:lachnocin radical SAM maturase n=1 Tax=Pseudobutyrivibrio sp. AR14 TaxID=1520804 RepID=UPI000880FDAE|nr:lachnocin radical SAM maturase [Pseudobutyrivibrio sp. AR14]SCY09280.1 uncharacterized protein SAMN05660668_01384 [Pseudobutyrivibrio sp. AR14]
MYLSKVIKTKNNVYLYDALNDDFTNLPSEDILDNEKEYKSFIEENGFRDINKPAEFKIQYPYEFEELNEMYKSKVKSITLALTEQCNLRCEYCGYMAKYLDKEYRLKQMPKAVAMAAIDLYMNSSEESDLNHIGFYGGEPLLRFELIKECIDYVKSKYPFRQPDYSIVTNAVLLKDDIADFLIENNVHITISLDGPTAEFNKYRVFPNGEKSFEVVKENIKNLYEKNPKYFREYVAYNSVLYNGPSEELYEAFDELWKQNVTLVDLFKTEYFAKVLERDNKSECKRQRIDVEKYDFTHKAMMKAMKKYYNAFNSNYASDTILPGGFCIPGIRKNFITTDGKILVCEKVDEACDCFEIGDVYNGLDIKKVERLIDVTLKYLNKCKNCWAARFCKVCFKDIVVDEEEFCEGARQQVEHEMGYYFERVSNDKDMKNYVANISLV